MSAWRLRGPELSTSPVVAWRSTLEGGVYRFRLAYRERHDCWDLQVATATGEVIVDGIRVSEGYPLLAAWSDIRLPPGELVCVDGQGLGAHPTRNDWRSRHFLKYIDHEPDTSDNGLSAEIVEVAL